MDYSMLIAIETSKKPKSQLHESIFYEKEVDRMSAMSKSDFMPIKKPSFWNNRENQHKSEEQKLGFNTWMS